MGHARLRFNAELPEPSPAAAILEIYEVGLQFDGTPTDYRVFKSLCQIYTNAIVPDIPLKTIPALGSKLSRLFSGKKMSPTDAKRGAKRRKNKRGGGSSCSAVCNTSSGKAGVVPALGTATPESVVSFLTSGNTGNGNMGSTTGINGEVRTLVGG